MARVIAALKASLGDTEYYIASLKVQELIDAVKLPKQIMEWDEMSIEDRYQRDINYKRVREQIAPYIASDESRFFGAFVLMAANFARPANALKFKSLAAMLVEEQLKELPDLHADIVGEEMGLLILNSGTVLVPLDGQHRLTALRFASSGVDERNKDISEFKRNQEILNEDVTVMIVPYNEKKARKFFTKLNRYAKPTTKGQNIVTDDDDIVAIIARKIADKVITSRLTKFDSNALRSHDLEWTTLATLYDCVAYILEKYFPNEKIDTSMLPTLEMQVEFEERAVDICETLTANINVFAEALRDKGEDGDETRKSIRSTNLLGRPIAQKCLVKAYVNLTTGKQSIGAMTACERLNALPWAIEHGKFMRVWLRVLWSRETNGNVLASERKAKLAVRLITYMCGSSKVDDTLEAEYVQVCDDKRKSLPPLWSEYD